MVSLAIPSMRPEALLAKPSSPSRKRERSAIDRNDETPSKRLKVAFDPHVEVKVMEDWNEKGFELVREEVRHALRRHTGASYVGEDADKSLGYDQIKPLFSTDQDEPPSTSTLKKYVLALTGNVSLLNGSCSGLIHAVLDSDWLGRDETYIAIYLRFLGSLVSARGGYISTVLKMLVEKFTGVSSHLGKLPESPVVTRPQLQARVHVALKYILQLMPSASGILGPILSASFPYATDTKKAHVTYVRNLLATAEYAPELQPEILDLITERIAKIDVQIQIDIEDLDDDVGDSLVTDIPLQIGLQHDDGDSDESDVESVMSDESGNEEERKIEDLKASVGKMDALLDLLFDYYSPAFSGKGRPGQTEILFDQLLSQFATIILPTYRSRYTQFLLFHFSQISPDLVERFVSVCGDLAFDKSRSLITRMSAAAYLSSFVARGAHVSGHIVREVFELLGSQLEILRLKHESTCRGPDLRRYPVYYAIAQALLYIFCFRWRDLAVSPNNDEDQLDDCFGSSDEHRELTWTPYVGEILRKNIYSRLNPLKVSAPAIVMQFARIAHHLQFMYVFPLLETNKRLRLHRSTVWGSGTLSNFHLPDRDTALSAKHGEQSQQLDTYFPFDPYQLPISRRWLEGDYNEWRSIPGLDDNGRGEDEGASSAEEEEEGEDDEDVEEESGTEDE